MTLPAHKTEAMLLFEHRPMVVFEEVRAALSEALEPLDLHFHSIPCPSARRAVYSAGLLHITLSIEDKPLGPSRMSAALSAPLTRIKGFNYTAAVARHRDVVRIEVCDGAAPGKPAEQPVSEVLKLIALHRTVLLIAERARASLLYWPQSETLLSADELDSTATTAFPAALAIRPEPGRVVFANGTSADVLHAGGAENLIGHTLMVERPRSGLPLSEALSALADVLSRMVLSTIGPGAVKEVDLGPDWRLLVERKSLEDGSIAFLGRFDRLTAEPEAPAASYAARDTGPSPEDIAAVADAVAFIADPAPAPEPAAPQPMEEDAPAPMLARHDPRRPLAFGLPVPVMSAEDTQEEDLFDATLSNEQLIAMELATRRSHAMRSYALCGCIAVITPIPAAAIFLWNLVRGPNLYVTLAAFGAVVALFMASPHFGFESHILLSGIARAAAATNI
ncbi:hypothetical protein [Anianabacter salinae]|uniref:hypothetical protein n=1 Tax=Anianabacter salinae TaxID=2851023 RepID=UPI00225E4CA2|nr:hypothetical protein [Anianabacter salinae]MBV0912920.1 hypothetical protein [Anianabacter salinae]